MSSRDKIIIFSSLEKCVNVFVFVRAILFCFNMNTYGFWFVVATFFYFFFLACSSVSAVFFCFTIFMVVCFADGAYAFQEIYTASPRKLTHICICMVRFVVEV